MSEQLYVLISNRPYEGGWTKYREATPEQIDEAAGVTELRKRLDQYQTLIDTQQGVIVEQRERCETTRELESTVVDLTCTISDLRAQLAQRDEDAAVGKAIREWFDRIKGRYLVSSKLEISVHRYDSQGIDEAHWYITARVNSGYDYIEDGWIDTNGKDTPDCPELIDALRAAGLLPVKEATDEAK